MRPHHFLRPLEIFRLEGADNRPVFLVGQAVIVLGVLVPGELARAQKSSLSRVFGGIWALSKLYQR